MSCSEHPISINLADGFRYNGTSDLQLERMNVYFNEVESARKISRHATLLNLS